MANVRELEDLIIDAIYLDILRGKLDQKQGQLEVEYTMGRDLEPGKLENILFALRSWQVSSVLYLFLILYCSQVFYNGICLSHTWWENRQHCKGSQHKEKKANRPREPTSNNPQGHPGSEGKAEFSKQACYCYFQRQGQYSDGHWWAPSGACKGKKSQVCGFTLSMCLFQPAILEGYHKKQVPKPGRETNFSQLIDWPYTNYCIYYTSSRVL